jgi:hypothetical protein
MVTILTPNVGEIAKVKGKSEKGKGEGEGKEQI